MAKCKGRGTSTGIIASWLPRDDPVAGSIVSPVYISAIFEHPGEKLLEPEVGDLKYSRENNPTVMLLEEAMACAEDASWSLAFNSGMAAISTIIMALARPRTRLVAPRLLYGATRSLLIDLSVRLGFDLELAGPPWDEFLEAVDKADLVLVETVGNPTLRVPPLREVYKTCAARGCRVIVDNTFASPVAYRPASDGAFLVVESTTKYISGHNDTVGGIVAGSDERVREWLWRWRKNLGTIMQPLEAYMTLRGAKTLEARFKALSENAMRIAEWLGDHPKIARVYYPGLDSHPDYDNARSLLAEGLYGAVVSFEVEGDAVDLVRNLQLVRRSPSLGGVETLASVPYISSHRGLPEEERNSLGITRGLVRLSVGLESVDDIIGDLEKALSSL